MSEARPERVLFITGKLAESALRRVLGELADKLSFQYEIAVMPITVAALLTTNWIARHLTLPDGISKIILPGMTRGELHELEAPTGLPVELGPKDLRDLPEFFGKKPGPRPELKQYDIEILAEINHAPQKSLACILTLAEHYRRSGADIIDLGCDPGPTWPGVGEAVKALKSQGFRVSVDSFNPEEVILALQAGAELVLSVNSSNIDAISLYQQASHNVEVVAIPDTPSDLASLERTIAKLDQAGVKYRIDPILEPIGFGFAESLQRYSEVRRRYPHAEIMMGIGNLTELTDADSSGVNVLLAGICQELGIRSVLTTEVINWCRSAVKEFDLARKLMFYAVKNGVLPKHLEPRLVMLRDRKLTEIGEVGLSELASSITDRNYRLFAERGELHLINGDMHLRGTDPFDIFAEVLRQDSKMDSSHAFYLGYEFAKAVTALTLGKQYNQDQALNWGFLTREEVSHR
jgi:dihydropteroate synthase-like protein